MNRRPANILLAAAVALPLAAAADRTVGQTAGQTRIEVSEKTPYGEYLTDRQGMSLYLFEADSPGSSTCYDACAQAWPPVLAEGEPVASANVDRSLLGTVERQDGVRQVTYDGWPLYYFARDAGPGDTRGQDVEGFGAEWYLVSPAGGKVAAADEHAERP